MTDQVNTTNKPLRTPSLRELKCNRPENVEILPTAQPRQVAQHYNRHARAERHALREASSERFNFIHPHVRAQMDRARRIAANRPASARDRLLDAIVLTVLTQEQREKLALLLACSESETARDASELVEIAMPMSIGDEYSLRAALEMVVDESD
ncbi:hypothetical protein [Parasphingorhabdus sp.]|uniref:hypothetical protein n=1 Tax=Parasphingorhabdus sp. TaxID=2709688 RepID=UPI0032EF2B56